MQRRHAESYIQLMSGGRTRTRGRVHFQARVMGTAPAVVHVIRVCTKLTDTPGRASHSYTGPEGQAQRQVDKDGLGHSLYATGYTIMKSFNKSTAH